MSKMMVGNIKLMQFTRDKKLEDVGELSYADLQLIEMACRGIDPAKFHASEAQQLAGLAALFCALNKSANEEAQAVLDKKEW